MDNIKLNIKKCSKNNSIIILVFLMLIEAFSVILVQGLKAVFKGDTDSQKYQDIATLLMFTLQYFGGVGIPLLYYYKKTADGKSLGLRDKLFVKPQMPWKWIIKFIFISFFIIYTVTITFSLLMTKIQDVLGVEFQAVDFSADNTPLSMFTNIFAMMFLAPVFEELLFRGTLVRSAARYGNWYAVIATGLLFGLWHMNYEQTFGTAAFGMCTAFIFIKTGSILPTILFHFCFNTIGALNSLYVDKELIDLMTNEPLKAAVEEPVKVILLGITGIVVFSLFITGLVLFIIELTKHRESFSLKDKNTSEDISENQKFAVYFSTPANIILTLVLIALTVIRGAGII